MENFERKQVQDVMPCGATDKTIAELKNEGWELLYSFHSAIQEQWRDVCNQAREVMRDDFYEVVLVPGQNEMEKKDGVQYLYRQKTQELLE